MKNLDAIFISAVVVAMSALFANPVRAEIEYPWCAQYSGGPQGGGTNCGFSTLEQCRATVSGIGGSCVVNQFYPGSTDRLPYGHRRR